MKGLVAVLFISFPTLVIGTDYLSGYCGAKVTLYDETSARSFTIINNFSSLCKVEFYSNPYKRVKLTITGNRLDTAGCKVNVYDGTETYSKTYGNIASSGSFSRTVYSNNYGSLYLHVQGPRCADYAYNLQFTATTVCPTGSYFQCNSGQCVSSWDVCDGYDDCDDGSDEDDCFWHTGSIAGVVIGAVAFVAFVAVLSAVYYRRRVMYVRSSPALISPNQAVITSNSYPPVSSTTSVVQSRW